MTRAELTQHVYSEIKTAGDVQAAPARSVVDHEALDVAVALSNLTPCSDAEEFASVATTAALLRD